MSRLATRHLALLLVSPRHSALNLRPLNSCRTYATHKDHSPSSLLSQQFDQRKSSRSTDSVGPFQLGIVQPSTQKVKKWSELSTGGKGAVQVFRSHGVHFPVPRVAVDSLRQCCAPLLGQPIFPLFLSALVSQLFWFMHWRQSYSRRIHLLSCMAMPVSELKDHHWWVSVDDVLESMRSSDFPSI